MKRTVSLLVLTAFLVVLAGGMMVQAQDYEPLPGVLGPEEVDFEGETVYLHGHHFRAILQDDEDVDTWGAFNETFRQRVAQAEDLFNVNIEGRAQIGSEHIRDRVLAGDATHDIYTGQHRAHPEGVDQLALANDRMLYRVGEFLPEEYYESLHNTDEQFARRMQIRGEFYSFGSHFGPHNPAAMFMMYNKDMLEEAGMPDPYELYLEDEWDYEIFEEMLIAVTQDTTGDGEYDQIGMWDNLAEGALRLLNFNQLEITRRDEDGNWIFDLNSDRGVNALNLMQKWRNEDEVFTNSTEAEDPDVAFSPNMAIIWWPGMDADYNFGIVPYPKGPDAEEYITPVYAFWVSAIPANAADPEGLVALHEYLLRPDDSRFDEEMQEYMETRIQTQEHWDIYMKAAEDFGGEGDPFQWTGLWDIVLDPINEVLYGEAGARARMDEIAPEAQAFIDDFFN